MRLELAAMKRNTRDTLRHSPLTTSAVMSDRDEVAKQQKEVSVAQQLTLYPSRLRPTVEVRASLFFLCVTE